MTQIRRFGMILAGVGLATTITSIILRFAVGSEFADVVGFYGALGVGLGSALWIASGAIRMKNGEVQLRPWDAAKKIPLLAVLFTGAHLVAWAMFPDMDRDPIRVLLQSAAIAVPYALYTTAYRKPA